MIATSNNRMKNGGNAEMQAGSGAVTQRRALGRMFGSQTVLMVIYGVV